MRSIVFVLAAASLIQACDAGVVESDSPLPAAATEPVAVPALPAVEGFAHQADADLFGYYLPASEVRIGDLRLSHFHLGDEAAFREWELAQGRGATNFAPVMFQFDDLSSPTIPNELGGQTPEVIVRVLPTGYGVSDSVVRFSGQDPTLGPVTFEGVFLTPAFARVRAGEGNDEIVLRGTLTIGERIFEGQAFTWTGGD